MGVTDSGQWFSRAFVGGLLGGLVAGLWTALYTGIAGLPWWSGLALYRTHLFGLSRKPLITGSLTDAVVAGCVWFMIAGLIAGALFGLLGGTLLPSHLRSRQVGLGGLVFGVVLYGLFAWGVPFLPGAATAHMAMWGRLVALLLMGWTIGGVAGSIS